MSNSIFEVAAGSAILLEFGFTISGILLGLIGFVIDKLTVGSLRGSSIIMLIVLFQASVEVSGFAIVDVISGGAIENIYIVHRYGRVVPPALSQ